MFCIGFISDQVNGTVTDALSNGYFRVCVEPSKHSIVANLCGKLRRYSVRIMRGDDVLCELSPYDLTKGRITFRNTAASRRNSDAAADGGNKKDNGNSLSGDNNDDSNKSEQGLP